MASPVKNVFFPLSAATVAFVAASWLSAPTQLSAASAAATTKPTTTFALLTSRSNNDAGSDAPTGFAELRVSQWGADRPAIDVSLDGQPWESNLRSSQIGTYISVKEGRHRVVIEAADDRPGADEAYGVSIDLRLESGARATLFPRPFGMTPGAVLVSDGIPKKVSGSAHLRVINLSEQQSTLWALSDNGLAVSADQRKSSGYMVIPTGTYTVRIAATKTTDPIIQNITISASDGEILTLVISDAGPSLDAMTVHDHRPDEHTAPGPTLPPLGTLPGDGDGTTVPGSTRVAGTTLPDVALPDVALPDTSLPDTSLPDTAVPDTTTPDTLPDTTTPDTTSPGTIPRGTVSVTTPVSTVAIDGGYVPTTLPLTTPSQLALNDRGNSRSTGDALVNALEGAGVALAVSEFVRRARRRNA